MDVRFGSKCEILCTSRCLPLFPQTTDVGLACPKISRYGISIAQDFRFAPIAIAALARTDERRHHDVLLDCPKSGKPTTRQINQRSLFCRYDHLRALSSTIDPGLDQFPGGFLTSRSGFAAWSGIPPPSHQIVLGEMLLQHR